MASAGVPGRSLARVDVRVFDACRLFPTGNTPALRFMTRRAIVYRQAKLEE